MLKADSIDTSDTANCCPVNLSENTPYNLKLLADHIYTSAHLASHTRLHMKLKLKQFWVESGAGGWPQCLEKWLHSCFEAPARALLQIETRQNLGHTTTLVLRFGVEFTFSCIAKSIPCCWKLASREFAGFEMMDLCKIQSNKFRQVIIELSYWMKRGKRWKFHKLAIS